MVFTLLSVGVLVSSCATSGSATLGPSSAASESAATSSGAASAEPIATADAATFRWVSAGSMTTGRVAPHVFALGDGRAFVVGDDTGAELWDPATGTWKPTTGLNNPRIAFAAVQLADGRVLVTGGLNDIDQSYSSAYVYQPANETWTKVGLMETARTSPAAALLPDGRVLVAGGYFHHAPSIGSAPDVNATLASYRPGESVHERPGLADLVPWNVGAAMATAVLFDPATGTWEATGPMTFARDQAAIATLSDGRVLVVGSDTDGSVTVDDGAVDSAELYDPATERFTMVGSLPPVDVAALEAQGVPWPGSPSPQRNGELIALADGGALLIGRESYWKHMGSMTRSFRFEVDTESWREIGQPYVSWSDPSVEDGPTYETAGKPRFEPIVAALTDGRVLVAGGFGDAAELGDTAELYDPVANTWTPLPDMPGARSAGSAVTLADGSVLLVGGGSVSTDGHFEALASAVRLTSSP